ncbi:Aflatoxin B1 aldehyde reductase member 2 [Cladochytrium tenue]|nr:Aflatoxin B1 aldehyde reductase member 2 [Cladochytrium tenue]
MVKIVFGTYGDVWYSDANLAEAAAVLKEAGIRTLDSARAYGDSEAVIGRLGLPARFTVDTKHPGGFHPLGATKESILEVAATSFGLLKTDQIDIYYLHGPDRKTPIEDTLEGINELYKQGRFKRFGLSNFTPDEVEEVVRVAVQKGYVLPTVYQGSYSAVWRKEETTLFPVLRRLGLAFYAYSPTAGGFLTKSRRDLVGDGTPAGRFVDNPANVVNQIYRSYFLRPWCLDFLDRWQRISAESAIPPAELANRWAAFHGVLNDSYGDAVIVGARTLEQLRETIAGLKRGPLPQRVVDQVEAVWDAAKSDALADDGAGDELDRLRTRK